MTTNRLAVIGDGHRGKVTEAMLHEHAYNLNQHFFVINSGKPYFVNKRTDNAGNVVHFLDRNG